MSKRFLMKCLTEIEDGLRKVNPDDPLSEKHMQKARHNLRAATKFFEDTDDFLRRNGVDPDTISELKSLPRSIDENTELIFYDWSLISSYYAIYHSVLALLVSIGYTSKSHACALAALEHFFCKKEVKLADREVLVIRRISALEKRAITEAWNMKDRRERTAYGVALSTERFNANESLDEARYFLEGAERLLKEITEVPAKERVRGL